MAARVYAPSELSACTERAKKAYRAIMRELRARGQENAGVREIAICAAQWMDEEDGAAGRIAALRRRQAAVELGSPEYASIENAVRAAQKARAMAQSEYRKNMDDLLLTPQRPRGRPPKDRAQEAHEAEADDGWDAFDEAGDAP